MRAETFLELKAVDNAAIPWPGLLNYELDDEGLKAVLARDVINI